VTGGRSPRPDTRPVAAPEVGATPARARLIRILEPGISYYLLAATFFVVVFGIIPFSIYAHSDEAWGFPFYYLLALAALGILACLAGWLLIRLLALVGRSPAAALACLLFCLGVFLLLAHVYAPIQVGPLDGSETESAEPLAYTLVELALLAAVIWMFIELCRGRGVGPAAVFSLALLLVGIGYASVLSVRDGAGAAPARDAAPAAAAPAPATDIAGSVYHIVLDRMQTDAFLAVLDGSPLAAKFDGFDLFKNNIANYISTLPSSASYLSGTLYKSGDYKSWVRGWHDRGLFATVADRGYETFVYAPFDHWDDRHIDHFRFNIDIYEEETGAAHAGLLDLLQVWLVSLAPNPLTNEAWRLAERLGPRLFGLLAGTREPLTIGEGLDPYAGMLMLRALRREEERLPADGRYVYAHAALPHTPFVLDDQCRYVGKQSGNARRRYLGQAECAVRLVAEFLDELKRLGRYDSATIVLHADTGHGLGGIAGKTRPAGARTLGVSDIGLVYTLQALLTIKPPGARGPLEIVDTPTQLVDLFPTILDLLDLEPGHELESKSVYALAPDERRPARFGFDPDKMMNGPNIVEVQIDDPSNPWHSKLTVLGPATDPGTWRPAARP
jgi:Sulfatase